MQKNLYQEFIQEGLNFFPFLGVGGAAQHLLGPKNPLKFLDFTGPLRAEPL